jgi:hypothetical protein
MTIQAPFHLERILHLYCVARHHVAMAALAFYLCRRMLAVAEEYKVRQIIYPLRRNLPVRSHIDVANFALSQSGKARAIAGLAIVVTRHAFQFQRGVPFVAERPVYATLTER